MCLYRLFSAHCHNPTGAKKMLARFSRVMVRVDVKLSVTRSRVAGQNYAGPGRDAKRLTQNLTLETIDNKILAG